MTSHIYFTCGKSNKAVYFERHEKAIGVLLKKSLSSMGYKVLDDWTPRSCLPIDKWLPPIIEHVVATNRKKRIRPFAIDFLFRLHKSLRDMSDLGSQEVFILTFYGPVFLGNIGQNLYKILK